MQLSKLLTCINMIVPKGEYVSFNSFPDYSDNARALFEYICSVERNYFSDEFRYVWHVNGNIEKLKSKYPNVVFIKKKSLKSLWMFMRSRYIISTHGLYNAIKTTDKQVSLLLWHGMPLKKIGYLNNEDVKAGVQKADYFIVTSKIFQELFIKIFHTSKQCVLITGQPRNDVLFGVNKILEQQISQHFKKSYIMYLPTYRKSNIRGTTEGNNQIDGNLFFGATLEQWKRLNNFLEKMGKQIIIKPHPMDAERDLDNLSDFNNIKIIDDSWLLSNNLTLHQLLACSDKLITDYSSVYIDYLLCDRPICFYIPDLDSYRNTRGFVFDDLFKYLPGKIITDFLGIFDFIVEEDYYQQAREKVNQQFNEIRKPEASKNICQRVLKLKIYR